MVHNMVIESAVCPDMSHNGLWTSLNSVHRVISHQELTKKVSETILAAIKDTQLDADVAVTQNHLAHLHAVSIFVQNATDVSDWPLQKRFHTESSESRQSHCDESDMFFSSEIQSIFRIHPLYFQKSVRIMHERLPSHVGQGYCRGKRSQRSPGRELACVKYSFVREPT
jgi:hypothetical protein